LSARQGDQSKFRQAMGKLHDEQSRKPTLVDRLRAAGL